MCLNSIFQQSCCSSTPAKSRARNLIFLMLRVKLFMLEVEHPPSTTPSHYDLFTSFPVQHHRFADLIRWDQVLVEVFVTLKVSQQTQHLHDTEVHRKRRSVTMEFPLAFAGRVSQHLKIVSNLSGFMLKNLRNKLDCKWMLRNLTKISYV